MPTTQWQITPSVPFEVLCFLNVLTGDPFYTPLYQAEYDHWAPQLPSGVQAALAHIKQVLKEEKHSIISADLCSLFSSLPDLTLDRLIEATVERDGLYQTYRQSRYYLEKDWLAFEAIGNDLQAVITFLRDQDFAGYWQRESFPQIAPGMEMLQSTLPSYDILPEVEKQLGYPLGSPEITAYLIHFTRPHGISLSGTRFITSPAWPAETIIRTSIHKMMHPPFDTHNQVLRQLIEALRQDAFLMSRFVGHNPSFGYNTLEGLIEEGCVQTLDQIISEHFGVACDPRERWKQADEGLHVFAVALYATMTKDGSGAQTRQGAFQDYLIKELQTTLRPGQIRPIYDEFYQQGH